MFDPGHKPDWSVFKEIFIQQDYASNYTDAYLIDIGAHRGMYAAYGLVCGAAGTVSYEPVMQNYAYLEATLEGFKELPVSVEARRCAVGAEEGQVTFYVYAQSWSHSSVRRGDKKIVREEIVRVVPLSKVISEARSKNSGRIIVKIDAEGVEFDMLLSTPSDILSLADEFFIETHHYVDRDPLLIEKHLIAAGFESAGGAKFKKGEHNLLHMVLSGSSQA